MPTQRKNLTNEFGEIVAIEITYQYILVPDARTDDRLADLNQAINHFENPSPKMIPIDAYPPGNAALRAAISERGCSECGHSPRMLEDGTCPILDGRPRCPHADFMGINMGR